MDKQKEEMLMKRFDYMFSQDSDNLVTMFGFDCGDGWYDILCKLFLDIEKLMIDSGKDNRIVIQQIKEKFGTLRFYYDLYSSGSRYRFPFWFNKLTKYKIQFWCDKLRKKIGLITLRERISERVVQAENESSRTCEICGSVGELRKDLGWWIVLCEEHYSEKKS